MANYNKVLNRIKDKLSNNAALMIPADKSNCNSNSDFQSKVEDYIRQNNIEKDVYKRQVCVCVRARV